MLCWAGTLQAQQGSREKGGPRLCSFWFLSDPVVNERLPVGVIVGSSLPDSQWFSAAEAAIGAIYALDSQPDCLASALIRTLGATASPSCGREGQRGAEDGSPEASCVSAASGCVVPDTGDNLEVSSTSSSTDAEQLSLALSASAPGLCSAIDISKLLFAVGGSARPFNIVGCLIPWIWLPLPFLQQENEMQIWTFIFCCFFPSSFVPVQPAANFYLCHPPFDVGHSLNYQCLRPSRYGAARICGAAHQRH